MISLFVCANGMVGYGQIMLEAKDNTTIQEVFYCNGMLGCKVMIEQWQSGKLALRDMSNGNAYIDGNGNPVTAINCQFQNWNHAYEFYANGATEAYYLYDSVNYIITCSTQVPSCISIEANTTGNVYCDNSTILTVKNVDSLQTNRALKTYWYKNGVKINDNSVTTEIDGVGNYRVEIYEMNGNDSILWKSENITIKSPSPKVEFDYSSIIKKKHNGSSSKSIFENIFIDSSCINASLEDFNIEIVSGEDDFELTNNELTLSANTVSDDYEAQVKVSYKYAPYSKTVTVKGRVVDYPKCYNVDRYIDNEFYDTYQLCTDENGNISIDLNDTIDDLVYISKSDFNLVKGRNPNNTISFNNGRIVYCNNVRFEFNNDIVCEDFIFNGSHVADNQYVNFDFVFNAKLACETMRVTQNEDQKRNYFRYTCSSEINAKKSIYVDSYNYDAMIVYGKMQSENITIKNGNNTRIKVHDCALVRANKLTLIQSGQNNVLIEGHVIADNVEAGAKLQLVYDGTNSNKAIVTIGELSSNADIVCGANTVVNLCKNPVQNNADDIGFFNGTVIYNKDIDGWQGSVTPLNEGDINEGDKTDTHSSNYWTYYNDGGNPRYNTKNFADLVLIAGYKNYDDCMNEKNMAALLPIELVSFNYQKGNNTFVWKTASETNNDYFVVEYSRNGKDWVECSEHVSSVSTNGYSYSVKPNMAINNSLFSYFRLKQVDYNGEYSYSNVITVSFSVENPCSEEYESSKVQIREFGNKWFRYINGELIYCENDN